MMPVQVPLHPNDLIGVFYSSGSTGEPKGIPVTHRNVLYRVWAHTHLFYPCIEDRLSHLSSTSFTASISDIFNALLNGATLCPRLITASDGQSTRSWIQAEEITVLRMIASLFRAALDSLEPEELFPSIRLLIAGGDVFRWQDLKRLFKHLPADALFMNRYSAGETGIMASIFLDRDFRQSAEILPAGYPMPGIDLLVLDEQLNRLETGEVGEIAVRSPYLFPGYWKRPDLTEKKLLPDPESGRQMVLTGDYGRMDQFGRLELLGRQDFVAKIRGYRVELQAIERQLENLEMVHQAAVIASEKPGQEKQLIAYIVLKQTTTDAVRRIREALGTVLPEYMIPSSYIFLDALPLTPNGKKDRKALPAPAIDRRMLGVEFVRPNTALETSLADIWKQVLKMDQVGLDDQFLLIGGDSLHAVQILARVFDLFHVEISIPAFFQAQTIANLSALIESPDVRSPQAASLPSTNPSEPLLIPRKSTEKDYPLSFAQERMWFIHQLDPQAPTYNEPKVYKIAGDLDVGRLKQAFQAIIDRHEILRTNYINHRDGPRQIVSDFREFDLMLVDLQKDPAPQETYVRLSDELILRPFDLTSDLMVRAVLFRFSTRQHILVLVTHHIASDQLSTRQMLGELSQVYREITGAGPLLLPAPELQYIDYALWQRARLTGRRLEDQFAFWKTQLADLPPLELSLSAAVKAQDPQQGERKIYPLPPELSREVKEFSRLHAKTVYMTLIAVFSLLLYRLSSQRDFGVGMVVANRSRPELEKLLGFFVNTLVLRMKITRSFTFRGFLEEVEQNVLAALEHQEYPFEKLVEELNPERDPIRHPFFQILFNMDRQLSVPLDLPGAVVERIEKHTATSKFDLDLTVVDRESDLLLRLEYRTSRFDSQVVDRLVSAYIVLLQAAISNPDLSISALPLITQSELEKVVFNGDSAVQPFPHDRLVHQLVEDQAAKNPDAVALVHSTSTPLEKGFETALTYSELNRQANRLAHHIQLYHRAAKSLVAVCLHRSPEMVVAFLAALKSGCAYLPLDPVSPPLRLRFIIEDARPLVLITHSELVPLFAGMEVPLILIDRDWHSIEGETPDNPNVDIQLNDRAYIIYTSGSTGMPKGVELEHQALLNLIHWHLNTFAVQPADRATSLAGLSFDASVWEIWPYLAAGSQIHLLGDAGDLSPDRLVEWLVRQEITISFLPTPVLESLLDMEWPPETRLRIVLTGGDRLRRFPPSGLPFRLVNNYGPTECTVVAASGDVLPTPGNDPSPENHLPAIGYPISNLRLYVLDCDLNPLPAGLPGELFIAGVGVGRGYLNRPDLTAERFLPDPFHRSAADGMRMFRSGDYVRYLPDGQLEFLGRIDDQLKLRGVRIEPGEIERCLEDHLAIDQAVVCIKPSSARPEIKQTDLLVAYVVLKPSASLENAQLHTWLSERLPEAMIPTHFILIDELPRLPSGKLDRRRLAALDLPQSFESTKSSPPTLLESTLASIWQDIFRIDRVDPLDHFFELGGHSLLAIRLVSQINELLGTNFPLREVFAHPQLRDMAHTLSTDYLDPARLVEIAQSLRRVNRISEEQADHLISTRHQQQEQNPE